MPKKGQTQEENRSTEIKLLKWISEAPFGESTHLTMSLNMVRRIEEIGLQTVSGVRKTLVVFGLPDLKLREPSRTLGRRPVYTGLLPNNEIRISNDSGLQAVIYLRDL